MMASPKCPCCGGVISSLAELQWNADARTLSGRGLAIRLPRGRARLFDALWRAKPKGVTLYSQQLMDAIYADDPSGGPDSTNIISVQVGHLKKDIAPFRLTISGWAGYCLIEKQMEAA